MHGFRFYSLLRDNTHTLLALPQVTPNSRYDWIIVCFDLRTKTFPKVKMFRTVDFAKARRQIFISFLIFLFPFRVSENNDDRSFRDRI